MIKEKQKIKENSKIEFRKQTSKYNTIYYYKIKIYNTLTLL